MRFFLRLVTTSDGEFLKIHHYSFLPEVSANDRMLKKTIELYYIILNNLFQTIVTGRHYCIIKKCDIKDAFCNILLVPNFWWFLEFFWRMCFYTGHWLCLRLLTLFFIFNMVTEAFFYSLLSFLDGDFELNFKKFMIFLSVIKAPLREFGWKVIITSFSQTSFRYPNKRPKILKEL